MDSSLIYDWNELGRTPVGKPVTFDDETLRDGLQSPSVIDPPIEKKLQILHLMENLGIESANIGLPGAGPRAVADVERLAREIVTCRMKLRPNCAARTTPADVRPIVEISQRVGIAIEVATFIGSSPIRHYAEDWTLDRMLTVSEEAVRLAVGEGLPVMFVTEDTIRSRPETIVQLYRSAIDWGARAIVCCDTVGHATPQGVRNLIQYVRREVIEPTGRAIRLDWHGHSDRGLAVINSIAAVEAGADQVHGCGLGIGERVGNTPMDLLLANLKLMGYIDRDLTSLRLYVEAISEATGIPIPANYPVFGRDAFRTATGVHAAAVIKALQKGDTKLANVVYSGVPCHDFGLEQQIEIGPMSGKSNVIYWLRRRQIEPDHSTVERIFAMAKQSDRVLTETEILSAVRSSGK
ncbi:MAG: LeuA family protein [Acidobacteriota bacterium]